MLFFCFFVLLLSTLPSILYFVVFARNRYYQTVKKYVQFILKRINTKIILIYCQLDVVLLRLLKKKHLEIECTY